MSSFPDSAAAFADRHIGPSAEEAAAMLGALGFGGLEELAEAALPEGLLLAAPPELPPALGETAALARLRSLLRRNGGGRSFIGCGYYDTVTPPVILRNVFENPGWYTAYTPYQAEISQGRLEALLNFQTLVTELTALPVANASLLDEATAAAEALAMAASHRPRGRRFFVSDECFPQTVDVLRTRAEPLGIELTVGPAGEFDPGAMEEGELIGILLQTPGRSGAVEDLSAVAAACRDAGGLVVAAVDPLALTLIRPPGEWGADIAVGSMQRFGVPLGFGGPHAAYMACTDELKRRLPGRLVGVSRDAAGRPALRLALQTREQHIRREKATSNICTAQVLLAVMAGLYAVWHGPAGLAGIASRIAACTGRLARELREAGYELVNETWFDTLTVRTSPEQRGEILARCAEAGVFLREEAEGTLGLSLDEAALETGEWVKLREVFGLEPSGGGKGEREGSGEGGREGLPAALRRTGPFLEQPVFRRHRTETAMLRYLRRLEGRDIALNRSMIPLGSCTMKLNAASEMLPLSWPELSGVHPFAPEPAAAGTLAMIRELEEWLAALTGFHSVSMQPNAGSQGEFAGLLAIRRYHEARGEGGRKVCLIPLSAHGTNPASAVMAGFRVVPVACDKSGDIDLEDLRERAEEHAAELGALMITYPSTHGVFEEAVAEICETVHSRGGQVYLDGANLNALVGLSTPASFGADVCHLNLHKTFCIPHGGGGPGAGPIAAAEHLAPHLPGHGRWSDRPGGAVSAAPYGSASILAISWMYIAMMGGPGLRRATATAILNANYVARRLEGLFPVLYRGRRGLVAHECIIDLRPCKERAGIDVEDIAKRLIDYGYHAPTMSWPVPGTLMIEPTESESKEELDRFCEAMIAIHAEIEAVASGELDPDDNPLKRAPHSAETLLAEGWERPYPREAAAYPALWTREWKYWPPVDRIDNVHGDRHLVCTCEGMEAYREEGASA